MALSWLKLCLIGFVYESIQVIYFKFSCYEGLFHSICVEFGFSMMNLCSWSIAAPVSRGIYLREPSACQQSSEVRLLIQFLVYKFM